MSDPSSPLPNPGADTSAPLARDFNFTARAQADKVTFAEEKATARKIAAKAARGAKKPGKARSPKTTGGAS